VAAACGRLPFMNDGHATMIIFNNFAVACETRNSRGSEWVWEGVVVFRKGLHMQHNPPSYGHALKRAWDFKVYFLHYGGKSIFCVFQLRFLSCFFAIVVWLFYFYV